MSDAVEFPRTAHDDLPGNLMKSLYDYMERRGWKADRHSYGASAIKKLIDRHGEKEVIRRVHAYIKHEITRPAVRCGQDFHDHWDWIGEQIARRELTSPVEVTTCAKRVTQELLDIGEWPDTAKQTLAFVVQRSLDNYSAFRKQFSLAFTDKVDDDARQWILADLTDPDEFVLKWFSEVYELLHDFDGWKGGLAQWVWTPEHHRFVASMEQVLKEYGANAGAWERLCGKLGEKGIS